ncbi:hypothetical protein VNI00_005246 [Paramarasmius palmivorus]|uniref:Zinc finger protein n=1 Tax=Paramarasmius palmivorus TaxID=297713 RepID=A0AAW0DF23_9AGAR
MKEQQSIIFTERRKEIESEDDAGPVVVSTTSTVDIDAMVRVTETSTLDIDVTVTIVPVKTPVVTITGGEDLELSVFVIVESERLTKPEETEMTVEVSPLSERTVEVEGGADIEEPVSGSEMMVEAGDSVLRSASLSVTGTEEGDVGKSVSGESTTTVKV